MLILTPPETRQEGHTYYCTIKDGNNQTYTGKATCCEEDYDYEAPLTGYTIAESRAIIKALKNGRKIAKIEYNALLQYYNRIRFNKHFNDKHQPYSTIIKMLQEKKDEIVSWDEAIKDVKTDIENFIKLKNKTYQRLRERKQDNKE